MWNTDRARQWKNASSHGDRDPERSPVKIAVARFRLLPAEVARHRFADHAAPRLRVVIMIERANRGVHELLGRVAVEQESRHAVLDRVGEAAHSTRDGDRAVALRTHLREPARLVL